MTTHTHDFTHRQISGFAPLNQEQWQHSTVTYGCCACGLSQPMAEHLEREVAEFLGKEPGDGQLTMGDA